VESREATADEKVEVVEYVLDLLASSAPAVSDPSASTPPQPHPLLNLANSSLNTPLHWAALNGHLAIVRALVEAGADAGLENFAGRDALFEAEENERGEVVGYLLGVIGIGEKREGENGAEDGEEDSVEEEGGGVEERVEHVREGMAGVRVTEESKAP